MDEAINEFCDLTYCAQWQALRAKVKAFLKDPNDHRDIICVELFDQVCGGRRFLNQVSVYFVSIDCLLF
jgi:hypothetical protein